MLSFQPKIAIVNGAGEHGRYVPASMARPMVAGGAAAPQLRAGGTDRRLYFDGPPCPFGRAAWPLTATMVQERRNISHRLRSLRRAERALPARGVEGQMKRPDRLHRQDPIHHAGIVFGDRPNLRLASRVVQDQSA